MVDFRICKSEMNAGDLNSVDDVEQYLEKFKIDYFDWRAINYSEDKYFDVWMEEKGLQLVEGDEL